MQDLRIGTGRHILYATASLAVVLSCTPSYAQQGAATPAAADRAKGSDAGQAGAANEIIVTAQRRSESLQRVPISVQVVSSVALTKSNISDTVSLTALSPSLNFSGGAAAAQTSFSLRGVSSATTAAGVQSSTALIIDGVPVVRQAEFISQLADVDRIEILNGPQGTLFGKNSTAGVINIVTKRPSDHFEAWVEGGASTDAEGEVKALVNLPVSKAVAIRVNGFFSHQSPKVTNLSGPGIDGAENKGIEGKISLQLADNVNLLLSGGYSHVASSYSGFILDQARNQQQILAVGYTPGGTSPIINQDARTIDLLTSYHAAGELKWDLSDKLALTSITSYRGFKALDDNDNDLTPAGVDLGRGFTPNPFNYPLRRVGTTPRRYRDEAFYYSEEARLNYSNGPLNAVAGIFYQHVRNPFIVDNPQVVNSEFLGRPAGQLLYSNPHIDARFKDRTGSLFGDVTYQIVPKLTIFTGLRYTIEREDIRYARATFLNNIVGNFDPITTINTAPPVSTLAYVTNKTVHNLSGRAGLKFEPTRDLNFYFSYARGYKGPGADLSRTATLATATVNPEIANSFELGAKVRLFGGRFTVNADIFDELIKGIQTAKLIPTVPVSTALINAGNLRTRGVEADSRLSITRDFSLTAGLAYIDASYRKLVFNCYTGQTTGCGTINGVPNQQNLSGAPAIGNPKWKYTVGGQYQHEFASGSSAFFQASWTWQSRIQYQLDQNPLAIQPGRGSLNASLGFTTANRRWDFLVFGKNITNKFYYSSLLSIATLANRFGTLNRDYQGYGGVTVKYHF